MKGRSFLVYFSIRLGKYGSPREEGRNTDIVYLRRDDPAAFSRWEEFLRQQGLHPGRDAELTVLLEENGRIAAAGSRSGSILKYFAVSPERRGEGLLGTVVTELRRDAFLAGRDGLFVFTKPENGLLFEQLHYYPVAETARVLLLESRRDGIKKHLASIPRYPEAGSIGAAVMNCDPFTLGHRHLIARAAGQCDRLYVFVLSEDRGLFSAADRLELVRRGTADLPNVTVCTTGGYLVSSATFPDYFLKTRSDASAVQCELDCEIFGRHFAAELRIRTRFAGSEPLSPVTECYNRTMERCLPRYGVRFVELPRLTDPRGEVISAGRVRSLLEKGAEAELRSLVPPTTLDYLSEKHLL